jgi:hypothetical protein
MAEEEGLSTQKKVIAGAALGVAVPAAIGVARKLVGGDESGEESRRGTESRRSRPQAQSGSRSTRSSAATKSGSSTRSRSGTRSASSSGRSSGTKRVSTAASRTKEQLYREAKRLNVEGRSRMTKAQLERAVARARS